MSSSLKCPGTATDQAPSRTDFMSGVGIDDRARRGLGAVRSADSQGRSGRWPAQDHRLGGKAESRRCAVVLRGDRRLCDHRGTLSTRSASRPNSGMTTATANYLSDAINAYAHGRAVYGQVIHGQWYDTAPSDYLLAQFASALANPTTVGVCDDLPATSNSANPGAEAEPTHSIYQAAGCSPPLQRRRLGFSRAATDPACPRAHRPGWWCWLGHRSLLSRC